MNISNNLGKQHYDDISIFQPPDMYKIKDKQKRELCEQAGSTFLNSSN